jgi:PAS domain-containing protein
VLLDDSGQPVRRAGVNLDITERKEAEAALRESEAHLRNAEV